MLNQNKPTEPGPTVKQPTCQQASRGFTIIELMIVVTLTAVLLAIAVPNFRDAIKKNQVTSNANGLVAALQRARSEAITRREEITVCAGDTSVAAPACSGSDWHKGWLVRAEAVVLQIWPAPSENVTILAQSTEGDAIASVTYHSRGTASYNGDAANRDVMKFDLLRREHSGGECSPNNDKDNARRARVERTGQVSIQRLWCES